MIDKYDITIDFLGNNVNIVRYLYDNIRVVDPNNKKVLFSL